MTTIWQDLRYSARLLLKHPGFTLTAVGVLTLGIGVNAGIFGIINGLMIRPLAGADAPGEEDTLDRKIDARWCPPPSHTSMAQSYV